MAQKKQIVAYAYENPVFEERAGSRTDKQESPDRTTKIDVGPGPEQEPQQLMYPDYEALFRRLKWQYWAFQFLILGHILIIAYTDPLDNNSLTIQVLIVCIQVGLMLAIMVAFFVFTSQTIFIQFGRYDKYFGEYKFFFFTFILEFLLVIAARAYYVVLFYQDVPPLALWNVSAYKGLWIAERVVLMAFWITAVYSGTQVFRERSYDPDYLLGYQH